MQCCIATDTTKPLYTGIYKVTANVSLPDTKLYRGLALICSQNHSPNKVLFYTRLVAMHGQWIVSWVISAGWRYKSAWQADWVALSYKILHQKCRIILRVTGDLGRLLLRAHQFVNNKYQTFVFRQTAIKSTLQIILFNTLCFDQNCNGVLLIYWLIQKYVYV